MGPEKRTPTPYIPNPRADTSELFKAHAIILDLTTSLPVGLGLAAWGLEFRVWGLEFGV